MISVLMFLILGVQSYKKFQNDKGKGEKKSNMGFLMVTPDKRHRGLPTPTFGLGGV
jgi:hypothetical protein